MSEASSGSACHPTDLVVHNRSREKVPCNWVSPNRRTDQTSRKRNRKYTLPDASLEHLSPIYTTPCSNNPARMRLLSLFGLGTKYNLPNKILLDIEEISEDFLRPDLIGFLQESLPRWKTRGFWIQEQIQEPGAKGSGRTKLFKAYSCICKPDSRFRDDQILNRMAVAMLHTAYEQAYREWRQAGSQKPKGHGRGDASTVIDDILVELHPDWHLDERKRHLRSRFHDKKRFGKRWLLLARSLGESILISCAPRIASAV